MATLQKFKLLATQCAVANSPTRSPTTSPVIHLRRRKTLRMFLTRNSNERRMSHNEDKSSIEEEIDAESPGKRSKELTVSRRKLKDLLLVSSPPFEDAEKKEDEGERLLSVADRYRSWRRGRVGSFRPLSAALRNRLLRRPWRPVLLTIPE